MTRFLKLVRHQDGKWKALPTETDDLTQVSLKERKYAPIDPAQLLKALDSLLSMDGGIKSTEDVKKIASLMKKFSKKLVSRCVYCNVLQATQPEILSEYLEEGGWETINIWLQYAKSSSSNSFLVEMLKLCKLLPMTLNRLKENNTAKVVKSLTKHDNSEVKALSSELVNKWMLIIKGKKAADVPTGEKKKKKLKLSKDEVKTEEDLKPENEKGVNEKHAHKHTKDKLLNNKHAVEKLVEKSETELIKSVARLKGNKRLSSDKELKRPAEYYEDVKIDPEPLFPVAKKSRPDRPKTAKVYQKNFRSTGLEEETPLPKNISKKTSTLDKTAVTAAKSVLTKITPNPTDRVTDKKIKPESLLAVNDNPSSNKGIKLIPAKPRPAVLQESASFMDALCQQPGPVLKRKKKPQPNKPNASPTSPTIVAPKLQFYKDTLEMNEDKEENSPKAESPSVKEETVNNTEESVPTNAEPSEVMEVGEEGGHTPQNEELEKISSPTQDLPEIKDADVVKPAQNLNELRSILSHGRRRGKRKSVKWVEDKNLSEVYYFEMDENERVNVLRAQTSNFGDLKTIEARKERELMEIVKRQAGDKMEESIRWWPIPILIDLPPPIVQVGSLSKEKEIERLRQQSTLQEIYFTREMIPDSAREPDLEIVPMVEPKLIPLDEENQIGSVMDYSKSEAPQSMLPEVLTSLIMNTNRNIPQPVPNYSPEQVPFESNSVKPPLLDSTNLLNHIPSMSTSYDPGEPITTNSLLPHPPMPSMLPLLPSVSEPQMMNNMGPPSDWRPDEMNMNPQEPYFRGYPMNPGPMDPMPNMNMRPRMSMMQDMYRPQVMPKNSRGPPRPRGRILCRHFAAGGCRFDYKCSFLHPGINGPPL